MERRILGRTGLEVSVLAFGGARIGHGAGASDADRLLRAAFERGVNAIDTAAAYGDSERLIGRALRGRRGDFVLLSKCGAMDGLARFDWSAEGILASIQASLANLGTDYLDVIQLHSCARET